MRTTKGMVDHPLRHPWKPLNKVDDALYDIVNCRLAYVRLTKRHETLSTLAGSK